jgi:hypothetical protein
MDANGELVEAGDLPALIKYVDRLCAAADWDVLVDLRDRSLRAVERGKQLWPVAAHIDYRLALQAPGEYAARAVAQSDGRFALGPLPEVAASTHAWSELAPHLPPGPSRELVAHERVVRGDDLRAEVTGLVIDLPGVMQPWEPAYPLATYHAYEVEAGEPPPVALEPVELPPAGRIVDDADTLTALSELTRTWTRDSNGRAETVAVEGDAWSAIAALGPRHARVAPINAADALAHMAWCAANGGAHGRRRGMAAGRFDAWWAAGALAGFPTPPAPEELGAAIKALRWWRWDAFEPAGGWRLQLAIDDPVEGLAWAVVAIDRV